MSRQKVLESGSTESLYKRQELVRYTLWKIVGVYRANLQSGTVIAARFAVWVLGAG